MPDLFGQPLLAALRRDAQCRARGRDLLIDAFGEEISRSQVPAEYQNQPILTQLPEAGAVVDAATTRLRLVVAAAVRDEPVVTMPSLVGLTQSEAATRAGEARATSREDHADGPELKGAIVPDFGIINFGEAAAASSFRKRAGSAPSPSTSRSRRPRPRSPAVVSPSPRSLVNNAAIVLVPRRPDRRADEGGDADHRRRRRGRTGHRVDIVLAHPGNLPVAVIPGIHQAFSNLTMAQLHNQFAAVPEVRDLVRTKTDASQLTADELTMLTTALQNNNVAVGTGAGETAESAFTAIQAAFTFQD